MNVRRLMILLAWVCGLVACSQPPTPTPMPAATPPPPTATSIPPTATPYPTYTPLPTYTPFPTATRPSTATPVPPTSTAVPLPSPTSQYPPIPAGMGGLISTNYIGPKDRVVNLEIGGKNYPIPGEGGQMVIHLAPGRFTFSANIARFGKARCEMLNGCTVEIKLGQYTMLPWY